MKTITVKFNLTLFNDYSDDEIKEFLEYELGANGGCSMTNELHRDLHELSADAFSVEFD